MTKEMISAEFTAIRLITKGFQICAIWKNDLGQCHTFASQKSVMPSLMDDLKSSKGMSHTFPKLLKWAQSNACTHIGAFTNVPNEEPIILFTIR